MRHWKKVNSLRTTFIQMFNTNNFDYSYDAMTNHNHLFWSFVNQFSHAEDENVLTEYFLGTIQIHNFKNIYIYFHN